MSQQEIRLLKDDTKEHVETIDVSSLAIKDPVDSIIVPKHDSSKSRSQKANCCRGCGLEFHRGILLSILSPNPHSQCLCFGCKT